MITYWSRNLLFPVESCSCWSHAQFALSHPIQDEYSFIVNEHLVHAERNSFSWKESKSPISKISAALHQGGGSWRLEVCEAARGAGPAYSTSGFSTLSNELLDKAELQEEWDWVRTHASCSHGKREIFLRSTGRFFPRRQAMHLLQGSKQQMVLAGGHCRGKRNGKTERERPARGCQGISVWPKEHNTGVSISGKTVGLFGRQNDRLTHCQNTTG